MDALWRRFRLLPIWAQLLIWLLFLPFVAGLFFWRSDVSHGKSLGVGLAFVGLVTYAAAGASSSATKPTAQRSIQPSVQESTIEPTPTPEFETPTPTPTPTPPKPTPTPTPTITKAPVVAKSTAPAPKPKPKYAAVNGNPWGFNWTCCKKIYDPPSEFCSYFDCIASFWEGQGYVIQCDDSMFSLSGGRQGACSHHGGVNRPLYAP